MKLVNDIIDECVDNNANLASILRKCLVLSFKLNNEKLREWVSKELDGYDREEDLPEYRWISAHAKGFFIGSFQTINDQPIVAGVMEKEHRHFAREAKLTQPIASYDTIDSNNQRGSFKIEWPADLVAHYQDKFLNGYVLNRAWIEIPLSSVVALLDTVRNRALRFALEIQKEIGVSSEDISNLSPEKVDRMVNNYIYGGNVNFISGSAHGVTQIGQINIGKADHAALSDALGKYGLQPSDVADLITSIEKDSAASDAPELGPETQGWIAQASDKILETGGQASVEVGKAVLTQLVLQFLGLS